MFSTSTEFPPAPIRLTHRKFDNAGNKNPTISMKHFSAERKKKIEKVKDLILCVGFHVYNFISFFLNACHASLI